MTIKIDGKPKYTKDQETIRLLNSSVEFYVDYIQNHKNITPNFNLFCNDKVFVFMAPWANNREKQATAEFVYRECKEKAANFLIFISDIWFVTQSVPNGIDPQKAIDSTNITPSEHPDRCEAVSIIIMYPDGRIDAVYAPYKRDSNNRPFFEVNPFWGDGNNQLQLIKPWVENYS